MSAGDGTWTREGTNPIGPQPIAFDHSTTPALLKINNTVINYLPIKVFKLNHYIFKIILK